MINRNRVAYVCALLAFCLTALLVATPTLARPKNILFVFSDDHACQAVGAYGSKINKTPHIDRLAEQGMRFDRCYVTNAICGPSRACILTGKYSHLNGFFSNEQQFDSTQDTFVTRIRDAGYQTAVIGKWHLGSDPVGFDHWDILPGQGRYYRPDFYSAHGRTVESGYVTDIITDKSIDWLEDTRREDRPFLLMVQHKAPHRSWLPGPDHVGDMVNEVIPEPETLHDDYMNRSDAPARATMRIGEHMNLAGDLMIFRPDSPIGKDFASRTDDPTEKACYDALGAENEAYMEAPPTGKAKTKWHYQRYIKNYLRCVASVDDSLGELLAKLESLGLAEDTVVIYSSDQGFFLGEHGWYDKRFMYEPSLRMPLVVRWPGVTSPGTVCNEIVSNVDFAETLLDAAEVAIPNDMQGESLLPLLQGDTVADWRKSFYYQFYEGPPAVHTVDEHYGVTDGRYKLIHFYAIDQWEMYDLDRDPNEMRSIWGDSQYSDVRERLEQEIIRLRGELGLETNDERVTASR